MALDLQRRVYEEDLGHIPIDGKDELAHMLIALDGDDEVIASFRIIGPEARPFDLERTVDLTSLIGAERAPGLIGRLVVRRDYRGVARGGFLQIGMLKLAYTFAVSRGITDFILYTYPNLIRFYRGAFFDPMNIFMEHPDWGQVYLMRMDILSLPQRCARSRSAVARLLSAENLPNFVV